MALTSALRQVSRIQRARVGALLLLPALVAVLINLPAITDSFQGDDFKILVRHRQDGGEFLFNAFREAHIGVYYRPFLDLSFFFQQKAFDDTAAGWHSVSVLMHAGSAAFLALSMLALSRRILVGALAGLTFALTPAYAVGVPWIANQSELLAGMAGALALALFVVATRDAFRPDLYWASVLAFAVALGAKEVGAAVLAPILLFAVLRGREKGRGFRENIKLLPFLFLTGAFAVAQLIARAVIDIDLLPEYHLGGHAFETARYLFWRLLAPAPVNGTGFESISDSWVGVNSPLAWAAVAGFAALCALALWRGSTAMRVMLVWLFASLVPNMFWEVHFSNARYLYTPALAFSGFAAACVVAVGGVAARHDSRAPAAIGAGLLLIAGAYAFGTLDQSRPTIDEAERQTNLRQQLEALHLDVEPGTTILLLGFPPVGLAGLKAESILQSVYGPDLHLRAILAGQAGLEALETEGPLLVLPTVDAVIVSASRWGFDPWQRIAEGPPEIPPAQLPSGYRIESVVDGLDRPTQMAFLPDGRLLVAERKGTVRVVQDGRLLSEPLVSVDAFLAEDEALGELGLTGIAVDQEFDLEPYVYLYYAAEPRAEDEPRRTVVARTSTEAGRGEQLEELLSLGAASTCCRVGGGMRFAPDGTLLVTVDDHQQPADAQSPVIPSGAVLRITRDGGLPADNPFIGPVFATGLRNPYDVAIDPVSGRTFASENGFMGQDAVVEIKAGANYGWPGYDLTVPEEEVMEPLTFYPTAEGIAGIEFYASNVLNEFTGHVLYCRFDTAGIYDIELAPDGTVSRESVLDASCDTDIITGPEGFLYFLDYADGAIYRIASQ